MLSSPESVCLSTNLGRYGRNAGRGRGRGERGGERGRQRTGGERRYHFIFIPFSKNGIHLLAQFAAKEMMNNVASSLRWFQGREEKCLVGAPRGRGLASSAFTSFSLVMIWETEKHYLSVSLELVLQGRAPQDT